jgi:hypothetical protein
MLLPRMLCTGALSVTLLSAALTGIDITRRETVLDGKPFGKRGAYERIVGKAYFAVDPSNPANRIIADVALAPRNAKGLVEFSADLYILAPRDARAANGTILFEVPNRGNKGILATFNRARSSHEPRAAAEFGDGFLLEEGFTLVWLGWQFDVPEQEQRLRLYAPVVKGIVGTLRSNFVLSRPQESVLLSDRKHIAYRVTSAAGATLSVRSRAEATPDFIPRGKWRFPDSTHVALDGGFEAGKIYEVIYKSQDPAVVGLGPAAVRDLISFLKYGGACEALADKRPQFKRALGFGTSQSGRFLRTFLYHGFNADENRRRVFDGVWANVAGGGRGSFNHRFAQASRDGHPFMNFFYPTDVYPFSDGPAEDGLAHRKEGLLDAAAGDGVVPKIFYTNGSYEYWGRVASLIHTSVDGARDIPPAPNTRIYFLTGAQHGPGAFPPGRSSTRYLANPNDFRPIMRALLLAMDAWLRDAILPPVSRYPLIANSELVPLDKLKFPALAQLTPPARPLRAYRRLTPLDVEPPRIGKPFAVTLPQVDSDGNEIAGVRMPDIAVPLATYTGWNFRDASIGAPDEMADMIGAWFPLAKTKRDREQNGDPRPSIAERYTSKNDYLARVRAEANRLVGERLLLARDVDGIVERCGQVWNYLAAAR